MRLSDMIRMKESLPITIDGLDREGLYRIFAEEGFTKGAEIGVEFGENASLMFHTIPGLSMILVDPWSDHPRSSYRYGLSMTVKMEQRTRRRLRHRDVTYHKMLSEQAAPLIEDDSLDFVYLDGDHRYDGVMLDIILWQRKVRSGGVIAGHDYGVRTSRMQVTEAVRHYTEAHRISPWFITDNRGQRERGSKYCSWFWVKA